MNVTKRVTFLRKAQRRTLFHKPTAFGLSKPTLQLVDYRAKPKRKLQITRPWDWLAQKPSNYTIISSCESNELLNISMYLGQCSQEGTLPFIPEFFRKETYYQIVFLVATIFGAISPLPITQYVAHRANLHSSKQPIMYTNPTLPHLNL